MNNELPKDPVLCLGVVNTRLRDFYASLDELCKAMDVDKNELTLKLQSIDYEYDSERNQFI